MDLVRHDHPPLRTPAAVIAFAGWGDAGEASSSVTAHLSGRGEVIPLATFDCDGFFDFQVSRPRVALDGRKRRRIVWPDIDVVAVRFEHASRDLVVVRGAEPNYRWRVFVRLLAGLLADLDVTEAVTLGAFIGQVPHTLPVPLVGVASDPLLLSDLHLFTSNYEGPTGIVGVLNEALEESGIDVVSVWAAVPHYVSGQPYPPGTLALLDKAMEILGVPLDTTDLAVEAAEFRRAMDAVLADSDDLADYVRELEEDSTVDETAEAGRLVEEIERFLRDT